jgi:hypothetical protein
MSEPSPIRQHLIDFAAKHDWKGWKKFLPIFGDWLDERGEPEAMACRATWRLSSDIPSHPVLSFRRHWIVPIPGWCSSWTDRALEEGSVIRLLDCCFNEGWFLHCAPKTLQLYLPYKSLNRHKTLWFYEHSASELHIDRRLDQSVVQHGLAALFWPPDTFSQLSNQPGATTEPAAAAGPNPGN